MVYTVLSFILSLCMVLVGMGDLNPVYYDDFPFLFFATGLPLLIITIIELMLNLNIIKKCKMALAYICFISKWMPLICLIMPPPYFWIFIFIFIKSSLYTLNHN